VARPALRLLQYRFDAERRDDSAHVIGLVPYNRHDFARLDRLASSRNVLDERPAACAVQHFCQRGFQPSPFARRQNHNHIVRISHNCILSVSPGFDNESHSGKARMEYLRDALCPDFRIDLFDN
jgi:hypothetical protein